MSQITESIIVRAWQESGQTELIAEDGEAIRVVYPGRVNRDQGPDLLDAVIHTSGGLVKGDIEVHARSSEWQAHHHHRDPAYNRVILHVVSRRDSLPRTVLQNQVAVPMLTLGNVISRSGPMAKTPFSGLPCRETGQRRAEVVGAILDDAGMARFLGKADYFRERLAEESPDQVLYEAIMEALGYSKNRQPFRELAGRAPFQKLVSAVGECRTDEEARLLPMAWLLGTAGLLPSQRSLSVTDNYVVALERRWAALPQVNVMSAASWNLCRLRPSNCPTRRLAAMSELVRRYGEKGLAKELAGKLAGRPATEAHHNLEKIFSVPAEGYWEHHFDFNAPVSSSLALLGAERAGEIAVNAVLPFIFALGQTGTKEQAREIYHTYPRLPDNTLEKHMINQLKLKHNIIDSACRQQGLLHIYKKRCSQGECGTCPLPSPVDGVY